MNLDIKDRVALIGGGSKGLGKACAMRLAAEGARVVMCARGEAALQNTAEEIRQLHGGEPLALVSDWSRQEDIHQAVEKTVSVFGGVDILVHNTGGPPAGGFFDQTEASWQQGFELTLMSAVRTYREVIPLMRKKRWGRIVNIESTTVKEPWDTIILSSVMRAGVASLAKTLSRSLAGDNILINTVCPGPFRTDRFETLIHQQAERSGTPIDDVVKLWLDDIPTARLGEPEEMGNLVALLASGINRHVTGTVIQIDGGAVRGML
ncbi:MAG: SDR family oxidoreductase [candidate division Zixibacteria bacterium]|nr:SDR family oxidoreductase [candidate division Zixibacteria bacterium]